MGSQKKTAKTLTRDLFKSEEEIEIDNMPKGGGFTKLLKLSDDLAAIVGKEKASRAECVKLLWAYLKDKELQDPENKQYFTPDAKMAKVFGTEKIRGFGMTKYLNAHLSPLPWGRPATK